MHKFYANKNKRKNVKSPRSTRIAILKLASGKVVMCTVSVETKHIIVSFNHLAPTFNSHVSPSQRMATDDVARRVTLASLMPH